MSYFDSAILGVIEGITEFLPISSTGHLLIAEHWLGRQTDTFNIVIQAGAILAVTLIYWRRIVELLTGWRDPETRSYLLKLITAFLITAVLGLIAKKLGVELPEELTPIAWALIIGGFWILAAEAWARKQPDQKHVFWRVAIIVGIAQIVAGIFPGTSRSGATIFAAMIAGTTNRAAAAEFAFLVGIPTMFAASGYEILSELKDGTFETDWGSLAVAFAVSTVTGFIAVRWLLGYIAGHTYTIFAYYRIAFGILLLTLPMLGLM